MWPNLALMHTPDRNAEFFACCVAECPRLLNGLRPKVDMGVVVVVNVFGALDHGVQGENRWLTLPIMCGV